MKQKLEQCNPILNEIIVEINWKKSELSHILQEIWLCDDVMVHFLM